MADVYLATVKTPKGPRLVALKRLRAGAVDPGLVTQLEREARIGALLNHPNVVGVVASGHDEKGPWMAMEYVAGRSARRLIRAHLELSRTIAPAVAATVCCDAAKGLAYVHGLHVADQGLHDLVHRDISSDNILVDLEGRSKLADFGVARIAGIAALTRAGHFKGKIAYAAPELLEGATPTHRSDYFAFAATVYELFTGNYAFAGQNEVETLNNLANVPAPQLVNAPADVAEWVEAALEKNPAHRPNSLTGLVLALNRIAAPHAEVARTLREVGLAEGVRTAQELTTQMSVRSRPLRNRVVLALLGGVAALAGAGLLWARSAAPGVPDAPVPTARPAAPTPNGQEEPQHRPTDSAQAQGTGDSAGPDDSTQAQGTGGSGGLDDSTQAQGNSVAPSPTPPSQPPAGKPSRARTALLQFKAKPWAYVWYRGSKLGITPFQMQMPVGRQEFEVRNPELNQVLTVWVDVRADEVNELAVDLYR